MSATTDTLREDGLAQLSARAVATRAGVNQALIFYHSAASPSSSTLPAAAGSTRASPITQSGRHRQLVHRPPRDRPQSPRAQMRRRKRRDDGATHGRRPKQRKTRRDRSIPPDTLEQRTRDRDPPPTQRQRVDRARRLHRPDPSQACSASNSMKASTGAPPTTRSPHLNSSARSWRLPTNSPRSPSAPCAQSCAVVAHHQPRASQLHSKRRIFGGASQGSFPRARATERPRRRPRTEEQPSQCAHPSHVAESRVQRTDIGHERAHLGDPAARLICARIANRVVADEYAAVSSQIDAVSC